MIIRREREPTSDLLNGGNDMADMKDRAKTGIDNAADAAKSGVDRAGQAASGARQEAHNMADRARKGPIN